MINKLVLFYSPFEQVAEIRYRLTNLPELNQSLEYRFDFQMPKVEIMPIKEEYKTIFGRTKQRVQTYMHYLEFAKPLTDEELKFWRIFKLGYLTKACRPKHEH